MTREGNMFSSIEETCAYIFLTIGYLIFYERTGFVFVSSTGISVGTVEIWKFLLDESSMVILQIFRSAGFHGPRSEHGFDEFLANEILHIKWWILKKSFYKSIKQYSMIFLAFPVFLDVQNFNREAEEVFSLTDLIMKCFLTFWQPAQIFDA
ncbi:hypothetical protein RCL_jg10059.t3 [Rhizophagus clarus]|uniref:Uncharacterized protein n=1 Tax=Rhizophagus clarus TaxID=94130 RepID=A0A8H3KRD2_9GLOM|nr:hypothetical protein RCL_jg10059.t3 [Rhizophagus clarus]